MIIIEFKKNLIYGLNVLRYRDIDVSVVVSGFFFRGGGVRSVPKIIIIIINNGLKSYS